MNESPRVVHNVLVQRTTYGTTTVHFSQRAHASCVILNDDVCVSDIFRSLNPSHSTNQRRRKASCLSPQATYKRLECKRRSTVEEEA